MFLPRFKNSRTRRSIKYVGAKIWNNIPNSIKKLPFAKSKSLMNSFLRKICQVNNLISTFPNFHSKRTKADFD